MKRLFVEMQVVLNNGVSADCIKKWEHHIDAAIDLESYPEIHHIDSVTVTEAKGIYKIAQETGLPESYVQILVDSALDYDVMGEYIEKVTDEGVYLMDVTNACGDYTIEPIPFRKFIQMLQERMAEKVK